MLSLLRVLPVSRTLLMLLMSMVFANTTDIRSGIENI